MENGFRLGIGAAVCAVLAGCGGSDGPAPAATGTGAQKVETTVNGSVVKGPVANAQVCFYKVAGGVRGEAAGDCVTTRTDGSYTTTLAYEGDVLVEAKGGAYTDEATGKAAELGTPLQVVVSAKGGTTTGVVTPLTTVAVSLSQKLSGGITRSNYAQAAQNVAKQFQLVDVDIGAAIPQLAGVIDAYGRALKAVSQYMVNGGSLATFVAWQNPAALATAYSTAYQTANGQQVTFTFNGADGITIGGTGGGGGSAECSVRVSGTMTVQGLTVPIDYRYCVRGLPSNAGCEGNAAVSQALDGQQGLGGAANLSYQYGQTCGAQDIVITLAS